MQGQLVVPFTGMMQPGDSPDVPDVGVTDQAKRHLVELKKIVHTLKIMGLETQKKSLDVFNEEIVESGQPRRRSIDKQVEELQQRLERLSGERASFQSDLEGLNEIVESQKQAIADKDEELRQTQECINSTVDALVKEAIALKTVESAGKFWLSLVRGKDKKHVEDAATKVQSVWRGQKWRRANSGNLDKDKEDHRCALAQRNFERYHGLPVGTATLEQVQKSSDGIEGWAKTVSLAMRSVDEDLPVKPDMVELQTKVDQLSRQLGEERNSRETLVKKVADLEATLAVKQRPGVGSVSTDLSRTSQASLSSQLYRPSISQSAVQLRQSHVTATCAYPQLQKTASVPGSVRMPPVREGVSPVLTPRTQQSSARLPVRVVSTSRTQQGSARPPARNQMTVAHAPNRSQPGPSRQNVAPLIL